MHVHGFACCFLSTPTLLSLAPALSTDLHASARNTIRFCALNRAHFSKFYTYVSRIVVKKPDTRRFSNNKLKPKDFIVFAYFCMFNHVNDNCLPWHVLLSDDKISSGSGHSHLWPPGVLTHW